MAVDEIGTAVLRGAVGTLPACLAVVRDARDMEGVFQVVVDELKVHPPVGTADRDQVGSAHMAGGRDEPAVAGLRVASGVAVGEP